MFKVGDKVVLINNEDSRIFVVDFAGWDTNLSVTGLSKYKDIRGYVWGKELFRPSTPEEIKAGHRIDNPCGWCSGYGMVGNMLDSQVCPHCNGDKVEVKP